MKHKILKQKEYVINNPIKKIAFYDRNDKDNKNNCYFNNRIPMALLSSINIAEKEYLLEENDIYFQEEDIDINTTTKIIEVSMHFAPTTDILNLYKNNKSFKGTIVKEITLFTSMDCYEIENETKHLTINTGLKNFYYGHILEYKNKNKETNKTSNLGYEFVFYINPNLYKYAEIINMMKEFFNID